MRQQTVVGVFDDAQAAAHAREELVRCGIPEHAIALSADMTSDDVAAEAGGQMYENQPARGDDSRTLYGLLAGLLGSARSAEHETAQHVERMRSGTHAITIELPSVNDADNVRRILERNGSRHVRRRIRGANSSD